MDVIQSYLAFHKINQLAKVFTMLLTRESPVTPEAVSLNKPHFLYKRN